MRELQISILDHALIDVTYSAYRRVYFPVPYPRQHRIYLRPTWYDLDEKFLKEGCWERGSLIATCVEYAFSIYVCDLKYRCSQCQYLWPKITRLSRCSTEIRWQLCNNTHGMCELGFSCAEFAIHWVNIRFHTSLEITGGGSPSEIDCDMRPPNTQSERSE